MFKDNLKDMVIYAQTILLPDEDTCASELNCKGLLVGKINQPEVRGRVNMLLEFFHNSTYSNNQLSDCGLHSAFSALEAKNGEQDKFLIEEAKKRGYELPTDISCNPVLCGIIFPENEQKLIPKSFHNAMLSLGFRKYDP